MARLPIEERESAHPISLYGASKLSAEHCCRLFCELHGLPAVSLRYFAAYGTRMRPDLAIAFILRKAFGNEEITISRDSKRTWDFTNVEDIVRANMKLLQISGADAKPINIYSGKRLSTDSIATRIIEAAGSNSEIKHDGNQEGDLEHILVNGSLAKELIESEASIDIEKGSQEYIRWIEAQRYSNGFGVWQQRC